MLPQEIEWQLYMKHSPPGTIIWLPLSDPRDKTNHLGFIIRETSSNIKTLPEFPNGLIFFQWKAAAINVKISNNKKVIFVVIIMRIKMRLLETNINVLHVNNTILEALNNPIILQFMGDSGKVERSVLIPFRPELIEIVTLARDRFKKSPWTDEEYNQAKAKFEDKNSLLKLWSGLSQNSNKSLQLDINAYNIC
jgi:hypothetical protein